MYNQTIGKNKCSELLKGIVKGEEIMNEDYIVAFREILQEAERRQQEALARFHSWSAGTMAPWTRQKRRPTPALSGSAPGSCAGKAPRHTKLL